MIVPAWPVRRVVLALLLVGAAGACSSPEPAPPAVVEAPSEVPVAPREVEDATAQMFDDSETHADAPPHGGRVVPLGAHAAHAELVIVPDTGELTVYLLDAEGQPGQRIAQPTMLADVETSGRTVRLELNAMPMDGERTGDASRFSGTSTDLLRMAEGRVTLRWIGVSGQVYSDVVVAVP